MILAASCPENANFWYAIQHLSVGGGIALAIVSLAIALVFCVLFIRVF